jgi:2'-5' RNA ligase
MKRAVSPDLHWPGYYDIVILPPPPVRKLAISLSRELRRSGGRWSLGTREFLPHISLYHIPVLHRDLDAFLIDLQALVETASFGDLETAEFDMPVLLVSKPDWLRSLQGRVVHRTLKFFNWKYGAERKWSLDRFSGRRLKFARYYLKKFGSPMMGMNFRPHITLSSFKGAEPADIHFDIQRMRFPVDRLYVCELGPSHSCQRIVRELFPRR